MSANAPGDANGDHIFLSYSTTPPENREFVRELARALRNGGFRVWLDEEQLPAGDDYTQRIHSAIDVCGQALIIATEEWLQKLWTRFEGDLLARRSKRILMIMRDSINRDDLGPDLYKIQHIAWPPGDPEPDARLWQVHCGLRGIPPGERRDWGHKWRQLAEGPVGGTAVAPPAPAPATRPPRLQLVASTPVLAQATDSEIYVQLEDRRWFAAPIGSDEMTQVPQPEGPVSDAAVAGNELVVSFYSPMMARYCDGNWNYHPVESCVLKLLSTENGLAMGHFSGEIRLLEGAREQLLASVDGPIIDMQELHGGLIVLDGAGRLWSIAWPELKSGPPTPIERPEVGQPVELFATGSLGRVGFIGSRRIGILHATVDANVQISTPLPEDVEAAVGLGPRGVLAALSESGAVWIVDLGRGTLQTVNLPGGSPAVQLLARPAQNCVLAVTSRGELFQIFADGTVRNLGVTQVLHAFAKAGAGKVLVVRQQDSLLQVQWIDAAAARSHSA